MRKKILILGSSFAGYTTAIELKRHLKEEHDIVVLARSSEFVFAPSLIWLPFGERTRADITFSLPPIYADKGIRFLPCTVREIDVEHRRVLHSEGEDHYDFLVVATGVVEDWAAVPGLGPRDGFTQSIFSLGDAEHAAIAFERFLDEPGPVVIGAVQGASAFEPGYEMLLNFAHQLRKHHVAGPLLTYLTPEPYLGHFGTGGFGRGEKATQALFAREHVTPILGARVQEVQPSLIVLDDGRTVPFAFAMLAPPFKGPELLRRCRAIANADGFVQVDEHYQVPDYPEIYAAGAAVAVEPAEATPVPCGVPTTGYLAEEMARVVVHNLVAELRGGKKLAMPRASMHAKAVIDAGDGGLIMLGDHQQAPQDHAWLIPGPEAHWAKLAFEKFFLATRRRGWAVA